MILFEDMKPIEHTLLHPICVRCHLMCACKHCNIEFIIEYIEVSDEFIPLRNTRFNANFRN